MTLQHPFFQSCKIHVFGALLWLAPACKSSQHRELAKEDELIVFAAASLRDAFTALGNEFKASHPGVEISFHFAGTQELRTQLEHGAAADVFASADKRHIHELFRASKVTSPITFARNEPVVIIAKESADKLRTFADLPDAARIVIATPEVPIGLYTLQILDLASGVFGADFRSRVEAKIVSREFNVRQVLAKVSLGEAQVGIVYRTDAPSSFDRVIVMSISPDINVVADYPIAVVKGALHPVLGRRWVEFVTSPRGQQMLRHAGFMSPGEGGVPNPAWGDSWGDSSGPSSGSASSGSWGDSRGGLRP